MLDAASGRLQARRPPWGLIVIMLAIAGLFAAEVALGTTVAFAGAVSLTLIVTVITIRIIGGDSIPALLIGFMMFRYLGFSQIAKTVLGQPAQTNLAAPELTIGIILVGTISLCAGAILVHRLLQGRRLIVFEVGIPQAIGLRNLTFLIGGIANAIAYQQAGSAFSEIEHGGIGVIASEFAPFSFLAIMADCWVALMKSDGRRSISPTVLLQLAGMVVLGFFGNSKQGTAMPIAAYLLASFCYRRRFSKAQILCTLAALVFGVAVVYPVNQLIRGRMAANHSVATAADDMLNQFIEDPASLIRDWDIYTSIPIEQLSIHEQGLLYLGSADDLVGRFLLIANTDVIVNAVEQKGPYGLELVSHGFLMAMPTLLLPDKPRINTCDLLTWFYGIRPESDEPSNPTIGLFADCYAAALWPGVILLPFLMMVIFLPTIQMFGQKVTGNIIASFMFIKYIQIFAEQQTEGFVGFSIRGIPFDALKIYLMMFVVNKYLVSRRDLPRYH